MVFISSKEGITYTPEGHDKTVTSRQIYKNEIDIHVTVFPPGTGMAEEVHQNKSHVFYVTEGKMSVLQTGKVLYELEKGDAVYIRKGEYHEVRNDMNSELTFVVITFFE